MGIGAAVPMVVVGALVLAPAPPPAFEPRELDAIREAVARYVIETQEPICRNYWDGVTYCLEFEQGEQPSDAFLQRLRDVAPGLRSVADCRKTLGMQGYTTDPFIQINSVTMQGSDLARTDVLAFCGHSIPSFRRRNGKWTISPEDSEGGVVGCGPTPVDCFHESKRKKP